MQIFRFLLLPFAILYTLITSIRNGLFSLGVFHQMTFDVPVLGIGNISTGGTGKSVAVDFFLSKFKHTYPMTVLSRGYGRRSNDFRLVSLSSKASEVGDEPLMLKHAHPKVRIGVSNKRRIGMEKLLAHESNRPDEFFLLDDCFQHRWVKPRTMILLTTYASPYNNDFILPVGNLRELSVGAGRADIIIVTKCPENITEQEKQRFQRKLQWNSRQNLFFSKISYSETIQNKAKQLPLSVLDRIPFILVTGIADASLLVGYLKKKFLDFKHLEFKDHHIFSKKDIKKILATSNGCLILTTQKDFVRLSEKMPSDLLYFLPIRMEILDQRQEELLTLVKNKTILS
ncbi:MAG: tetraacyldisaccharide 4'-kinase [Flavobacteriaceae bacterium]